jgi:YVTN family beta-propeller protein
VQDPAGKILYVANENDNTVTIIDIEKRARSATSRSASSPKAWRSARTARSSSTRRKPPTWRISSTRDAQDRRQRAGRCAAALCRVQADGSELWVSSEIGGTVSVIDPAKHEVTEDQFEIPGLRREAIQPVGISITKDGKTAFVALGPANRIAVVDAATIR